MPLGLSKGEINGFYNLPEQLMGKSVQPSYRFTASFLENPFKLDKETGPMPIIMPHHFVSVSLPTYQFKFDKVMYGSVPRIFSTIDFSEGLKISITFEEDMLGTIAFFINWCQRNVIDNKGYYNAPLKSRIGHFVLEVVDMNGVPTMYYVFKNLLFESASNSVYDYGSDDVIRYDVSFVCEVMETYFIKYGVVNKVQKAVGIAAGGPLNIIDGLKIAQ